MRERAPWATVSLGEVASIFVGGTPSTDVPQYWGKDFAWINSGDLHARIINSVPPRVTARGLGASSAQLVTPPMVALGLVGQGKTRGTVALINCETSCSQSVALIKSTNEKLYEGYLFHNLDWRYEEIRALSSGAGRGVLSKPIIARLPISLPAVDEQRQIAEILDVADDRIRRSEEWIDKAEVARKGTLTDLLAREPYPRKSLSSLLSDDVNAMRSGPFGSSLLASELRPSGIPVLGIDNVFPEDFRSIFTRFVDQAKFRELQRYQVKPGDVMITIMGTVGRCCVVPENIGPALSSKHVWTLTLDSARYRPWLACLQINYSPWVHMHFSRDTQGGVMSAIRSETLRTLTLPVPPMTAQLAIESTLRTQADRIAAEHAEVEKLRLMKKGLMDDLLSGKVRVGEVKV